MEDLDSERRISIAARKVWRCVQSGESMYTSLMSISELCGVTLGSLIAEYRLLSEIMQKAGHEEMQKELFNE